MRGAVAPALAGLVSIACAVEASADEPPTSVRVPIVVVDLERGVERAEVDAVEQGLGAPAIRGAALARAIGAGAAGVETADSTGLGAQLVSSQDLFFAGEHEPAREGFEQIVDRIEGDPCALVLEPELGPLAFRARLYLAVIARGDGDEPAVERQISLAVERYPGLAPEPVEFPPWLCEAHRTAREQTANDAAVRPSAPESCEIDLGGGAPTARVGQGDLRVVVTAEIGAEDLAARAAVIARAGGWPRVVVAVGRADGLEVALIDADSGRTARTGPPMWSLPGDLREEAETDPASSADRAWYDNGLAWAVTGIGLAAAGTGFALGRAYGSPSEQEPLAWSLMAAGAGLATTGVVLFFVPAPNRAGETDGGVAVGATAAVSF